MSNAGCPHGKGFSSMNKKTNTLPQPQWYMPHANMRTDTYVLLAALLNSPPGQDLIKLVQELQWDEDISEKMQRQLNSLKLACQSCKKEIIAEEFNRLFVGLGRGEMVPYGSWYREKMIQSSTLAAIRSDLRQLGIVRQSDSHESEDHAGALCEIMALISQEENEIPIGEQSSFFAKHIGLWMVEFFKDLQSVQGVEFYRVVGAFGVAFLEAETEYLQNSLHYHNVSYQGGIQDDSKIF